MVVPGALESFFTLIMDHTAMFVDKTVVYSREDLNIERFEDLLTITANGEGKDLIWRITIIDTMMRIMACAKGKVQGVGYRYFVTDCAQESGVSGFVKNMPDGSVLIVAEGRDDTLDKFVRMVKAQSDPLIRVDSLEISRCKPTGEFSGFGIRW